jgi:hypothetical protein
MPVKGERKIEKNAAQTSPGMAILHFIPSSLQSPECTQKKLKNNCRNT